MWIVEDPVEKFVECFVHACYTQFLGFCREVESQLIHGSFIVFTGV